MIKQPQKTGSIILNKIAFISLVVFSITLISCVWVQHEIITKISKTSFLVMVSSAVMYWAIYYKDEMED